MTIDYGTLARIRRKELGLTQKDVADLACCNRETVVCFENNTRSLRFDIVQDILSALRLKLAVEEDNDEQTGSN